MENEKTSQEQIEEITTPQEEVKEITTPQEQIEEITTPQEEVKEITTPQEQIEELTGQLNEYKIKLDELGKKYTEQERSLKGLYDRVNNLNSLVGNLTNERDAYRGLTQDYTKLLSRYVKEANESAGELETSIKNLYKAIEEMDQALRK